MGKKITPLFLRAVLLMLLAVSTSVKMWSQDDDLVLLTGPDYFTATDVAQYPSGNNGQVLSGHEGADYDCLLDGKYTPDNHSMWFYGENNYTSSYHAWIEFQTTLPIIPKKYVLITGSYEGLVWSTEANPTKWIIKAKRNKDDEWKEIANVSSNCLSNVAAYTPTEFDFTNDEGKLYQYFRFDINDVYGMMGLPSTQRCMQLEELQMKTADCVVPVPAIAPTCTEDGRIECWYRYSTGKYYSDENGENEIDPTDPALGHHLTHYPAKTSSLGLDGNIEYWRCDRCGKYFNNEDGADEHEITQAETISSFIDDWSGLCSGDVFKVTTRCYDLNGNKQPENLLDGKLDTDWYYSVPWESYPLYIGFKTVNPIMPQQYILTTANNTEEKPGYRPASWTIKAKLNENDEWVTIADVSDDETLPAENQKSVTFDFNDDAVHNYYQYFRMDITKSRGESKDMELAELQIRTMAGRVPIVPMAATCTRKGYTTECWYDVQEQEYYTEQTGGTKLTKADVEIPALGHNDPIDHHEAVNPTLTTDGNIEYWYCSRCGKYFNDADLAAVHEVTKAQTIVRLNDQLVKGLTAVNGIGDCEKLVDGKNDRHTKWAFDPLPYPCFIELHSERPITPTQYVMETGDQSAYAGKNPKSWTIKAKLKESDEWETIADVVKSDVIQQVNTTAYTFDFDNTNNKQYQIFQLTITETGWANRMELGELGLKTRDVVPIKAQAPTCIDKGYQRNCYYQYSTGKYFEEESCNTEINANDVEIPALGHDFDIIDAIPYTEYTNGQIKYWHCKREGCGWYYNDEAKKACQRTTLEGTVLAAGARVPASGTETVYVGNPPVGQASFKVWDDGGKEHNYTRDCNGDLIIVAPEGYAFKLKGTTWIDDLDDLSIYSYDIQSNTTGARLMYLKGVGRGNEQTFEMEGMSKCLRIHFYTDYFVSTYAGLDIDVTLVPITESSITFNNPSTGSMTASVNSTPVQRAIGGSEVTLTATPQKGYHLTGIDITYQENNATQKVTAHHRQWYEGDNNTASFMMPNADVTITPIFTYSGEDLFVNMPMNSTMTAIIPDDVTQFKVYDHGGKDGGVSHYKKDYLILKAPEGKVLEMEGILQAGKFDTLWVYAGADQEDRLLKTFAPAWYNEKLMLNHDKLLKVGPFYSNTLMLYFDPEQDGYDIFYEGLDLTVNVLDAEEVGVHNINYATVEHGHIKAHAPAKVGEEVYLDVQPDDGYVLASITATDANGKELTVQEGITSVVGINLPANRGVFWYAIPSFMMSKTDVTITPFFKKAKEEELQVRMLYRGTLIANIPASLAKDENSDDPVNFRVLPQWGNANSSWYGRRTDSYLILNAPEGYVIELDGTFRTEANYDFLSIFGGTTEEGDVLVNRLTSQGEYANESTWTAEPIGPFQSQNFLLHFTDGGSAQMEGVNLRGRLLPASKHEINIAKVEGGVVTGPATCQWGGWSTLTAQVEPGYRLEEIKVTYQEGEENKEVTMHNVRWYHPESTFRMPDADVTVTPIFTKNMENLSINMPVTGTINATIPVGVTHFKVFDNGGKESKYSNYCNGYLALTAPEGYSKLVLSGTVETQLYDELTVYGGTNNSEVLLDRVYNPVPTTPYNIGVSEQPDCDPVESPNLLLNFQTDPGGTYAGLDLDVKVIANPVNNDNANSVISALAEIEVPSLDYDRILSAPATKQDADAIINNKPVYVYTTCLPYAPPTDEGINYYTLNALVEESLQFVEIEGSPAANTPYLVTVSDATNVGTKVEEPVTLKKEADNNTTKNGYKFVGTTIGLTHAEAVAAGAYILQDGNVWGKVQEATTDHPEYGYAYIPPFRAYIVATNPITAARRLNTNFDEEENTTTSINSIQLIDKDGTEHWYDLNGRPIEQPATKGVYVKDGKKVVIK